MVQRWPQNISYHLDCRSALRAESVLTEAIGGRFPVGEQNDNHVFRLESRETCRRSRYL